MEFTFQAYGDEATGYNATITMAGKIHRVPAKMVTDHEGSSWYAAYETIAEARKAALAEARRREAMNSY